MRRAFTITFALALGAVAASSCDDDESIDGLVNELIAESNMQIDQVCGDCRDELGYQTRGDCEDAFGFIGPSRERCVLDAYKRDEGASEDYLTCIRPLEKEYTACLMSRLDCDDAANSIMACDEDYDIGKRDCIELPQTIQNAYDDCFPNQGG